MARPRNNQSRWNVLAYIELSLVQNHCAPTVREICTLTGIRAESHVWKIVQELISNGYLDCLNNKARTYHITAAGKRHLQELRAQGHTLPDHLPQANGQQQTGRKVSKTGQNRVATYINQAASIGMDKLGRLIDIPILGRTFAGTLTMVPPTSYDSIDPDHTLSVAQGMLPGGVKTDTLFALEVRGNSMIDAHIHSGDFIIARKTESAENGDMVVVFLDDENETTLKYFFRKENHIELVPANSKMNPITVNGERPLRILGKVVRVVRL